MFHDNVDTPHEHHLDRGECQSGGEDIKPSAASHDGHHKGEENGYDCECHEVTPQALEEVQQEDDTNRNQGRA